MMFDLTYSRESENEKSKTEKNLGKSVEKIWENPTDNLAQKKKIGWFLLVNLFNCVLKNNPAYC